MQTVPQARRLIALVPVEEGRSPEAAAVLNAAAALASSFEGGVEVVFIGRSPGEDCVLQAQEAGVSVAWLVQHAELGDLQDTAPLLAACQDALKTMGMEGDPQTLVLCAAGPVGEELAARLAIRMGGVPLGRCAQVSVADGAVTAQRAAFGGRAQLALSSAQGPWFAALRGGKPDPSRVKAASEVAVTRVVLHTALPHPARSRQTPTAQSGPMLSAARTVVAGGRGMAGEAGFKALRELADAIGAALGGSLPAIDAGWVPVSAQVGQSGKFVTPETYVAVGISGTPQHMAGVGADARIIAINSDPEADIFKMADIGVVAKWEELLPALLDQLRARG